MKTEEIKKRIETMSLEEMKDRLSEYMKNDLSLEPGFVAVEVRLKETNNNGCRYDILLIDEEGKETQVKFKDRCSRLLYVYTLLHPQGYQRRVAANNNYQELRNLYNVLYFKDAEALVKTISSSGSEHFFNHYIAQSRKAVRQASPLAETFVIDRPQSHNGRLLIPFVAEGGTTILDATLRNFIH